MNTYDIGYSTSTGQFQQRAIYYHSGRRDWFFHGAERLFVDKEYMQQAVSTLSSINLVGLRIAA